MDGLIATGKVNDRGEEYFLLKDDFNPAGNSKFAYVKRSGSWLRARYLPHKISVRASVVKESDPYRNVWDENKEYYGEELSKHGSVFLPTCLELAGRHARTARFHLWRARELHAVDDRILAYEEFQEGLKHRRIASKLMAKYEETRLTSLGAKIENN